jgi:hypothetical protein
MTSLGEFSPIGRLVTSSSFMKITEVAHIFGVKVMHSFWQKMGWATFWVIFLQLHLVSLATSMCQLKVRAGPGPGPSLTCGIGLRAFFNIPKAWPWTGPDSGLGLLAWRFYLLSKSPSLTLLNQHPGPQKVQAHSGKLEPGPSPHYSGPTQP